MTQADSLCNKLRTIASSDKSAMSELTKQKSNKKKEIKKEEPQQQKTEVGYLNNCDSINITLQEESFNWILNFVNSNFAK